MRVANDRWVERGGKPPGWSRPEPRRPDVSHPAQMWCATPPTETQTAVAAKTSFSRWCGCVLAFLMGGCSWGTTAEGPEMNMPQLDNKLQLDQ